MESTNEDNIICLILELLGTLKQACLQLYQTAHNADESLFRIITRDMTAALEVIEHSAVKMQGKDQKLPFLPCCLSIVAALQNVITLYETNPQKCLCKIEFELLPLVEEGILQFYYWGYACKTPERIHEYHEKWMFPLSENHYVEEAMRTGHYKYEVAFLILAYNKLEYTKLCVQNLLKNIPENCKHELILVNHGSNDGTKEFFAQINSTKQLDVAVNGGGVGAFMRIVESEFLVVISNDVIVAPHTLENLILCIRSDPKIAWVVPSTPNISNLQTIPAQYTTLEEMTVFARDNNQSNPFQWEQRVRLCNPIDIRRMSVFSSRNGIARVGHLYGKRPNLSFGDDMTSLLLRRMKYKVILAKDSYCFHFGSVTLKSEIQQENEQKYYLEGRKAFFSEFGVDPWGVGSCYDPIFLNRLVGNEQGHVGVLGINCGLGSNSLKIKEQIKEYCHNLDCTLSNITDNPQFLLDLIGIGDEAVVVDNLTSLTNFLSTRFFHYIVWETPFLLGKENFYTLLTRFTQVTVSGGRILLKASEQNASYLEQYKKSLRWREIGNQWFLAQKEFSLLGGGGEG